ncbi:hypothetical protein [Persephonella sp.]
METWKLLNRFKQLQKERETLEFKLITNVLNFPITIEDIGLLQLKVLDLISEPAIDVSYITIYPLEDALKFKVIYNSKEEIIGIDTFKEILTLYTKYLDEYVRELKREEF